MGVVERRALVFVGVILFVFVACLFFARLVEGKEWVDRTSAYQLWMTFLFMEAIYSRAGVVFGL